MAAMPHTQPGNRVSRVPRWSLALALLGVIFSLLAPLSLGAAEVAKPATETGLRMVEQYNFSIHIMAMLLVGFGFLMVFVRNYGYSATSGTYLVVAVGLPL